VQSGSVINVSGAEGGSVRLVGSDQLTVNSSASISAGSAGSVQLLTREFGTCSNDPTRACLNSSQCTVGCETGTCLNISPDTGGTTSQFTPEPLIEVDSTLAPCS
jgi:hypothetical protein